MYASTYVLGCKLSCTISLLQIFFFRNRVTSVVDVEKCGFVIVQNRVMSSEIGSPVAALYVGFMKLFVKLKVIVINVLSTVMNSFWIMCLMCVSFRVLLKMLILSLT
jgi:hypothetical protein